MMSIQINFNMRCLYFILGIEWIDKRIITMVLGSAGINQYHVQDTQAVQI